MKDPGLIPGLGRFSRRREWLPTPVFLPGESQKQRSLAGHNQATKHSGKHGSLSAVGVGDFLTFEQRTGHSFLNSF